jgi:hypothetical protein
MSFIYREEQSAFFMQNAKNCVELYILAGVATSENFMDDFRHEMVRRYEQAGFEVLSSMLFPYGDSNRSILKQVLEISYDLLPRLRRNSSYIRGQIVADYIMKSHSGGKIVIVGHSSGGVAGVHAANKLDRNLYPDVRVIQIGSPKCAVSKENCQTTLYLRAVNSIGKSTDPITRLGSWGGWVRKGAIAHWHARLKAPSSIVSIPIVGGHADYFRTREPFVNESGKSNLEITTDVLWDWL